MQIIKFKIKDRRRYHFGDSNREIKSCFSSNQLFSAIINAVSTIYDDDAVAAIAEKFKDDKISISSMFPGVDISNLSDNNTKTLHFFPMPHAAIRNTNEENQQENITNRKKKKNLEWLSQNVLKNLLNTWNNGRKQFEYDLLGNIHFMGSNIGVDKEELTQFGLDETILNSIKFMSFDTKPRNRLNRWTGASEDIYYVDSLLMEEKIHGNCQFNPFFYFLMNNETDKDLTKKLNAAIRFMADEGIGGKRSIGMGFFDDVIIQTIDADSELESLFSENSDYYMSLASILPENFDTDNLTGYGLKTVSGYIHSGQGTSFRRKMYKMLTEGSIFEGKIGERIVDVKPNIFGKKHPVYLYGKGIQICFGGDSNEI